jgi:xanthosine utilization system XapX-like protein
MIPDADFTHTARLAIFNQVLQLLVMLGLVSAVLIGVIYAGEAMLAGKFEGPNFLAVVTGLLGLIGGGALGMNVGRAPQRMSDPRPSEIAIEGTKTTTETTKTERIETPPKESA